MALSPRVSIASSNLSMCADETSRLVAAGARRTSSLTVEEPSRRPRGGGGTSLASFLTMSRVKQLTVISFSLSNLGVGCFFSILGPFFPTEVLSLSLDDQSISVPTSKEGGDTVSRFCMSVAQVTQKRMNGYFAQASAARRKIMSSLLVKVR